MKISKFYQILMAAHEMDTAIQHGKKPSRAVMMKAEMPEAVIKRLGA